MAPFQPLQQIAFSSMVMPWVSAMAVAVANTVLAIGGPVLLFKIGQSASLSGQKLHCGLIQFSGRLESGEALQPYHGGLDGLVRAQKRGAWRWFAQVAESCEVVGL